MATTLSLFRWLAGHWQKLRRRLDPPYFRTRDVQIGKGVRFGRNVEFNCARVRIGDGCIFMDNIVINAEVFEIGDFGTVGSGCFFPGPGTIGIGHNFWCGNHVIIDGMGSCTIGHNVGIGAMSQLWTHLKFGEIAAGARFHHERAIVLEDEAWILPGCILGGTTMKSRSMLLPGAVLTRDTRHNTIYAGIPAKSVSERLGPTFEETPFEERMALVTAAVEQFVKTHRMASNSIQLVHDYAEAAPNARIVLHIADRTYRKRGTRLERKLMRFLLPDFKFLPVSHRE